MVTQVRLGKDRLSNTTRVNAGRHSPEGQESEYTVEPVVDFVPSNTLRRKKTVQVKGYDPAITGQVVDWGASRIGSKFPNRPKQLKHVSAMLGAGYTQADIQATWQRLEADPFWASRGFDFSTVANEIGKQRVRRVNKLNAADDIEL